MSRTLHEPSEKVLWRSLDELAETPAFREALEREFPAGAIDWSDGVSRRRFLGLMGASLALAGLSGCRREPAEKIVPYVRPPEEIIPGKPLEYATAFPWQGYGMGVLVQSHMGRPTKIEGNPDHPASKGSTNTFCQSSILELYDPDRSTTVQQEGRISTWGNLLKRVQPVLGELEGREGEGLRILTGMTSSPTFGRQIDELLSRFPQARWHTYEPVDRDHAVEAARRRYGETSEQVYHFDRAEVVVSLGADFLFEDPGSVRYGRDVMSRRRIVNGQEPTMNRLYAVEPTLTITGAMADHRVVVAPGRMESMARALAMAVEGQSVSGGALSESEARVITAMAADLNQHRGAGIVIAGAAQAPVVHELALRLNDYLQNTGPDGPVEHIDPVVLRAEVPETIDSAASLRTLCDDMRAGRVRALFILGGNPAYNAPADLNFGEALESFSKAAHADGSFQNLSLHLGMYDDETSWLCQCHVPWSHYLESWSDIRGVDGTATIIQPLIRPLYDSRSIHEMLSVILGEESSGLEMVRATWRQIQGGEDFETFWKRTLEKGVVEGSAFAPKRLEPVEDQAAITLPERPEVAEADDVEAELHLLFRPDPSVWDGSFCNVSWQQELPRPFTKLTWDNAALISPGLASREGLKQGDVVELRLGDRAVNAPVMILPGQSDDAVTVQLGYGRRRMGKIANGVGFNAYALRHSPSPWAAPGVGVRKTGERHALVTTQHHQLMDANSARRRSSQAVHEWRGEEGDRASALMNRNLVRVGTLDEFRKDDHFVEKMEAASGHHQPLSLYPEYAYEHHKWGMSIDLNTCIGCNACTVACQAENNIPVVGKEQVAVEREMHWIRVDSYFEGSPDDPHVYHQPVPCMHCENAPCEVVCPVAATVHDSEGLNVMVYNRCVGTRYCSNNCPYKVRRFNYLQYSESGSLARMQKNPNVTVRSRGVMEKCTYCIQRINTARIEAKKENRPLGDGEIVTACQQVCPTQAIVFGDLNNTSSQVAERKRSPLDYGLLTELSTKPRTTYMARLRNPNPDLEKEGA